MAWRNILREAQDMARGFIGEELADRRNHPLKWAIAHARAATHFRLLSEDARRSGKRARAWVLGARAMWHRGRRRKFEDLAYATAQAAQCRCAMREVDRL